MPMRIEEQRTNWEKTNKREFHFKWCELLVFLVLMHPLLSRITVLDPGFWTTWMTSCKWANKCTFSFWQHKNVKVFLWTIVFQAACKRAEQLPTLLRQQCWELLRACWQWCANRCNSSQQVWDLQCIVGRIQPIGLCNPCVMSVRGPYNVGRTVQTDPTLLRYASAITEQRKCWEFLAEKFDRS